MPTYNPTNFESSWAGIRFQGEMDGDFLEADYAEPGATVQIGSKGFGTITFSANKKVVIKITLSQESPTNKLLTAAYAAKTVGPWLSTDLGGSGTSIAATEVVMTKFSPLKRGDKVVGNTFEFEAVSGEIIHGSAA